MLMVQDTDDLAWMAGFSPRTRRYRSATCRSQVNRSRCWTVSLSYFQLIHLLMSSDFHGRVHKGMAKQLAQLLEPHRPLFIEEPLLPGHVNELKDLYNKTTIPIAVSLT
jgi:hypothetical protein